MLSGTLKRQAAFLLSTDLQFSDRPQGPPGVRGQLCVVRHHGQRKQIAAQTLVLGKKSQGQCSELQALARNQLSGFPLSGNSTLRGPVGGGGMASNFFGDG